MADYCYKDQSFDFFYYFEILLLLWIQYELWSVWKIAKYELNGIKASSWKISDPGPVQGFQCPGFYVVRGHLLNFRNMSGDFSKLICGSGRSPRRPGTLLGITTLLVFQTTWLSLKLIFPGVLTQKRSKWSKIGLDPRKLDTVNKKQNLSLAGYDWWQVKC